MYPVHTFAQLTGNFTIPGTPFSTIKEAIDSLNLVGVGAGDVTFNIAAGYTETAPANGYLLGSTVLNATTSASNQIVFQKSSTGVNPLITAFTPGTSTTVDGIWKIQGTDYVTIDGIDLQENSSNITATELMEWGYALVKLNNTAPFDGCQYVTIKNCTITLSNLNTSSVGIYAGNHIATATTSLTITDPSDAMNNCGFYSNTINSAYTGIRLGGYAATSPFTLYDQNNDIGSIGGNTITNFGGGSATAYGIYSIYQNNINVENNSISGTGASTLYGIFCSTGTSSNVDIVNNYITVSSTATASALYGINNAMGSTAAGNTVNIINNTVENCQYLTATSGTFYSIYNTASAENVNIIQNTVNNNISAGTGGFYGIYSGACPNLLVQQNTVSNNQKTGASGSMYLSYASTSIVNYHNNNLFNNSIPNSSGTTAATIYGYYNFGSPTVENIHHNNIYNNSVSGTNTSTTSYNDGIYSNTIAGDVKSIFNNNIYGLTAVSGSVNGIRTSLGNASIYNNDIYNLTNNTAATTAASVNGITIASGNPVYFYNNFISDLKAPQSAGTDAIRGINITSATASSVIGLYYNTIFLNALSTGANFGSSGVFHTTSGTATTASLDMRNNIIVNTSTPSGTGLTVAYRRSSTTLTNYNSASNNNDFYAGLPSATNLIFSDGTNFDSTIADYKTRVSPRDAASFSENPPFEDITTAPFDLHLKTNVPTQIESGGIPISSPIAVVEDFDGDTRNASTPDIGADEFSGMGLDLSSPLISYTPLLNTSSLSSRTLTATIVDASGVPTSGLGLPVLYWKIGVSGSYTSATGTYLSGDDYSFTFGSGVVLNDTVFYYIVAQDNASVPNVGASPSSGAGGFTANPPAASIPPTDPSDYFIIDVPLAGDYTVGTALFNRITGLNLSFEKVVNKVVKEVDVLVAAPEIKDEKGQVTQKTSAAPITEKQLMEVEETTWIAYSNGQPYTGDLYVKKSEHPELNFPDGVDGIYSTITAAVADLNLRGVSAPVRFLLTDASYSSGETFPITVYITNNALPTATNTVTFKPNTGVTATITGSTAQNVFGIYDSYVTIDGSNTVGGTSRDLTIINSYTGGSFNLGVVLWNGGGKVATNTTVKNCIIEGSPTPTSSYGLFLNANGGAYHNTSFINNKIQNVRVGIQFVGVDGSKTNDGLISGNIIGEVTKPIKQGGILAGYVDNLTITENDIFGEIDGNTNTAQYGISLLAGSTSSKITKNKIHDFYYTGTSGYGCFGIRYNSDATTVTEISNNFISNIKSDGDVSSQNFSPSGIYIISGGNINLYYNSIYMSGSTLGRGTTYNGRSICVSIASGITLLDFRNNIFQNSMDSYPGSTRTNTTFGVYSASANTAFTDINYNDYFVDGVGPRVGYLGGDQTDLTAWQTATGKDVNSISANPQFESTTDLHIQTQYNVVDGKAQPIAAVLTDIDNDSRNATTPDIGADEYTFVLPTVVDPTAVSAIAISGEQIDISFTPNPSNNNVVIVYNLTGTFTAPTGTPTVGQPLAGGEVIAITTTAPFSHLGLTQLTTYYYKLFSYDGTDYSPGVSANATTPCLPISTFPWNESFETVTIPAFPDCWFRENGDWVTTNNANSTYDADARTGTQFLRESYTATNEYMWTPGFQLTAGTLYDFSFWWAGDNYAGWTGDVFMNTSQVSTGAAQIGTSFVESGTTTTKTYQQFLYTFAPSANGTYYFAIRVNATGVPWYLSFDDFSFDVAQVPTAPSNLTAVADTFAILLNWDDNSATELGFKIERKNGDSLSVDPFVEIDSVGANVTSYNDLGRTPNTTYTYRVRAFNQLGFSLYSNEVTATTIIPVELTSFAANISESEVLISWTTATELNNKGFDLERKLDGEWQKLAFIEGMGTKLEETKYSYNDKFSYTSYQGTAQYRLKQIDYNGTISYSNVISVELDFTPKEYALYQNYPNPFNPATLIKFALPFESSVKILVYNLLGEKVDILFEGTKEAGYHDINWNAGKLASGIYLYTIEANSLDGTKNFSSVKKMMLMK
jgi:hypothetical protein